MPTQEQYRHRKCVGSRANKLSVGCGFVSIIFFISPFSCCSMLNNVQGRNVGLRAEREQDDPISLPFAQFALTTETILDCIERERQNVFYKFIIVDLARYAQFVYGLTAKLSQKLSLNALNLHNSAFTHSMCQTTCTQPENCHSNCCGFEQLKSKASLRTEFHLRALFTSFSFFPNYS